MAVVDAHYKFVLVDVGKDGRNSDGGIYRDSFISKNFQNGVFKIPPPRPLFPNGINVTYFLIGDAAFPLSLFLMRPFAYLNLTASKMVFNYRLSRARRCVENAFGILAARWRIFRKPIIADKRNIIKMVKACICLHNFLIQVEMGNYCPPGYTDTENEGVLIPGLWRQESSQALINLGRIGSNRATSTAMSQREYLKNYFLTLGGCINFQWNRNY